MYIVMSRGHRVALPVRHPHSRVCSWVASDGGCYSPPRRGEAQIAMLLQEIWRLPTAAACWPLDSLSGTSNANFDENRAEPPQMDGPRRRPRLDAESLRARQALASASVITPLTRTPTFASFAHLAGNQTAFLLVVQSRLQLPCCTSPQACLVGHTYRAHNGFQDPSRAQPRLSLPRPGGAVSSKSQGVRETRR